MSENLVHYTSMNGLKGIIEGDSLRFTKSEYLNDPQDCELLLSLIDNYYSTNYAIEPEASNTSFNRILAKASPIDYIKYVLKKINFYVLSFSSLSDDLSMWNYYGSGGAQITVNNEILRKSLISKLAGEREFIVEGEVIYIDEEDIKKIEIDFSQCKLFDKSGEEVFQKDKEIAKTVAKNTSLYSIKSMSEFFDKFLDDYKISLHYLDDNKIVNENSSTNDIFLSIFENVIDLDDKMLWKRDMLMYIIVLNILIKSKGYACEKEHRIAYFGLPPNKKDEYGIKCINGFEYIYPFITFNNLGLNNFVENVILSPLVRNNSIDEGIYCETIKNYLENKKIYSKIVEISKHKKRW